MAHVNLNPTICCKARLAALTLALLGLAPAAQASTWNLLQINAEQAHAMGFSGKGVVVGVIDAGFNVGHHAFTGRVSTFGRSFLDPDPSQVNDAAGSGGHDTHVAGIIGAARGVGPMYGVAFDATILPIKAIGAPTFDDEDDYPDPVEAAFTHAIAHHARVINGSFGPPARPEKYLHHPYFGYFRNPDYKVMGHQILLFDQYNYTPYEGDEAASIQAAADADIVIVFAAGNEFGDQPIASRHPTGAGILPYIRPENHNKGIYRYVRYGDGYQPNLNNPRTYTYVDPGSVDIAGADYGHLEGALITVVALDRNARISSYSNRCGVAWRWCLAAPGGDLDARGKSAPEASILSSLPEDDYGLMNGTSMASPTVAGAAAVVRGAFPYLTARQTIELLLTSANTSGHLANRSIYGRGLLDLGRAVLGPREFGAEGFAPIFDIDTNGIDTHWQGNITGSGGLTKRGAGLLRMTGANTYRGDTQILGGGLELDGLAPDSNTYIGIGATLSGTGTAGPTTVAGTVSPGAQNGKQIGTLKVAGDLVQLPGSHYPVTLLRDGVSDQIRVDGNATITDAHLSVAGFDPAKLGQTFRILSATGRIAGTYVNTTQPDYLFVDLGLRSVYDPATAQSAVQLDVKRTALAFADVVHTPNQRAAATAVDSLPIGNPIYDTVVSSRNAQPIAGYMDGLSGELHASVVSGLLAASTATRDAVLERLRSHHRSLWGTYLGSRNRYGARAGTSAMTERSHGFAFGVDHRLSERLRAGLALSYADLSLNLAERQSRAAIDSYAVTAYASLKTGPARIRGSAGLGWHEIGTHRQAVIMPDMLAAHYHAYSAQVYGEVAYPVLRGRVTLEPVLGLRYAHLRTTAWRESGGAAALRGQRERADTSMSTLGVRATSPIALGQTRLVLTGLLAWEHVLSGRQQRTTLRLDASAPFTVRGVREGQNALRLEAGVDATIAKATTLSLAYKGVVGKGTHGQAVQARMHWYF